jgi:hypothetical protein
MLFLSQLFPCFWVAVGELNSLRLHWHCFIYFGFNYLGVCMAVAATALLGLSILVIGDSHMATPSYLIQSLPDSLMEQGAVVHSIGV